MDPVLKKFSALPSKTTIVEADSVVGLDSQDGKKLKLFSLPGLIRLILGNRSIGEESAEDIPEDSIMTTNATQQVREKTMKSTCAYESTPIYTIPSIIVSGVHMSTNDGILRKMAWSLFRRLIGAGYHHFTHTVKAMERGDSYNTDSSEIIVALSLAGYLQYETVKVTAFAVLAGEDDNPTILQVIPAEVIVTRPGQPDFRLEITPDISATTSVVFCVSVWVNY